jgi:uncharacterized protein YbaR (Trm112 family)
MLMDKNCLTQSHLDRLMSFDYLACPRCHDGIFTDDDEGIAMLIILGLPRLLCPFCSLEYDLSFYLGDNDNE